MDNLLVAVIDSSEDMRNRICSMLPDYARGVQGDFSQVGSGILVAGEEEAANIVIINAKQEIREGLYVLEYMRTMSYDKNLMSIPVIVLIDDEFSDLAYEFLEIDDVSFYEGELEEDKFFSVFCQAVEAYDFREEPYIPSYSEEKNYDRVTGLVIKPLGEDEDNKRAIALDLDTQLVSLQAAIEHGQEKVEKIREFSRGPEEIINSLNHQGENSRSNFLGKIRKERGLEPFDIGDETPRPFGRLKDDTNKVTDIESEDDIPEEFRLHRSSIEDDIPEEFRLHKNNATKTNPVSNLTSKIKQNPFNAGAAAGIFGRTNAEAGNGFAINTEKYKAKTQVKTVVVVDDDEKVRKMCEAFLGKKYNVVTFSNGRETIDYFVKNKADLLMVDTYLPSLNGRQIVNSIRWQPNGRSVSVMYFADKKQEEALGSNLGEGIVGVIEKPLMSTRIISAVDGFFGQKR